VAIWQFDVVFVPRDAWLRLPARPTADELLDTEAYWADVDASALTSVLASIGAFRAWWTTGLVICGDEQGTCIQASTDDGRVEDVRMRLDLRAAMPEIALRALEVATQQDWLCIVGDGEAIEPTVAAIAGAARGSAAAKSVADPRAFLASLARPSQ
jgi:hypothetical protein